MGSRAGLPQFCISLPMMKNEKPFLSSVEEIRRRAREHMERGPVTPSYKADLDTVIRLLNEALATELVCVLRYKSHYYMADGLHAETVKAEFLEHANEEQQHADQLAERIRQLGGVPNFNPEVLTSMSHAQFSQGGNLIEMIQENLLAERIAIESYREIVQYLGNNDSTSRRMMEGILATEEEHADDMQNLLVKFQPGGKRQVA
jgi:bacterioferritin